MQCLFLHTWVKSLEMNVKSWKTNHFWNYKSLIISKSNLLIVKKLKLSLIIFGWIKTLKIKQNKTILTVKIINSIKLNSMSKKWSIKIISKNKTSMIIHKDTKTWKINKFKIKYSAKIWKKSTWKSQAHKMGKSNNCLKSLVTKTTKFSANLISIVLINQDAECFNSK